MLQQVTRHFGQASDVARRKMRHGTNDLSRGEFLFGLARGIHFCDDHLVRILERTGKIEETGPCSGERGFDLSGMVGVIIEDEYAVYLSSQFKAAACAAKFTERLCS